MHSTGFWMLCSVSADPCLRCPQRRLPTIAGLIALLADRVPARLMLPVIIPRPIIRRKVRREGVLNITPRMAARSVSTNTSCRNGNENL